jgi:large-conductance mechanosensitive channel
VESVVGQLVDTLVDALVDTLVDTLVDLLVDALVDTLVKALVDPLVETHVDPVVGAIKDAVANGALEVKNESPWASSHTATFKFKIESCVTAAGQQQDSRETAAREHEGIRNK